MNKEILTIIESLSNEKSISKDKIFNIIENTLKISIKKKYNNNININVCFNKELGTFKVFQKLKIVDNVFNTNLEISSNNLDLSKLNLKLGDYIEKELNYIEFNRIATQFAKTFLFQKVYEIEKFELINKFKNFIGKIFICVVKKIKRKKIILYIENNTEGIIYFENLLFNDNLKLNDKIKCILYDVKNTKYGIQLLLSRLGSEIIKELFKYEIPEINKKIIEIKSIARKSGIKTKIALKSNNINIDPIGHCIGNKGFRIKSISNELKGECIDLVLWDKDIFNFIINSIYPINIISMSLNKNKNIIDIIINKNDISKVIGKNGLNIKLITSLVNYELNIISNNN